MNPRMHDVAKPETFRAQKRSPVKRVFAVLLWIVLLAALVAGLKLAGLSVSLMLAVVFTVVALVSALMSFRAFRQGRTTAGALLAVLCLLSVLVDIKVSQVRKMMATPFTMPPTTVSSVVVKQEDWSPRLSAVGSISPVQGAVVATELGGVVSQVAFQNGAEAKKGDVLIQLDVSSEEAQLHTAQAELELARANLERTRGLAARKVVSNSELDAAESAFKQKQGTVDNMRSMMGKKEVRAPFDGQLGIRQVNVGQMINSGQQVVALTALDPVYVDFALPQQELSKLSTNLEVQVQSDAVPG